MHSFWNMVFRLKVARPGVSAGIYAEVPRDLLQGAVLLRTRPWLRGRLLHQGDFFTPVFSHLFWHSCLTRHQKAAMMYKYPLSKCLPSSSASRKSMQCDQSFSWAESCMYFRCPKSTSRDSPFSPLWAFTMPSFLAFCLLLEAKNIFVF